MKWTAVAVEVMPGGTVLKNPTGYIRSLNPNTPPRALTAEETARMPRNLAKAANVPAGPDYHWEERDQPGPFEYVTIENGRVAYNPLAFYGEPGEAVVFGFMEKAPNSSYSWLTLEPLTI